jgi:hypothetical protein
MTDLRSTQLRLRTMGPLTTQEKTEFQNLDAAYREAWARLLLRVSYWQSLNAGPNANGATVQKAWDAVERAEVDYRQSRNRLAGYLLPNAVLAKQLVRC